MRGSLRGGTPCRRIAVTVRVSQAMVGHLAEAIDYVANEVFDGDEWAETPAEKEILRKTNVLRQAAQVCAAAKSEETAGIGFTQEEADLVPEACRHVAHEIFDGKGDVAKMLNDVSEQIVPGSVYWSPPRPR